MDDSPQRASKPRDPRALDPATVRNIEAASVFAHVSERTRKRVSWPVVALIAAAIACLGSAAAIIAHNMRGSRDKSPDFESSDLEPFQSVPTESMPSGVKPFEVESIPSKSDETESATPPPILSRSAKIEPAPPESKTAVGNRDAGNVPDEVRGPKYPNRSLIDLVDPLDANETADPREWK
jgi:hypothetical protein